MRSPNKAKRKGRLGRSDIKSSLFILDMEDGKL